MTIAPMLRLTLCGPLAEKEAVLEALQDRGCVHLVPLREPGPLEPPDAARRRRADAAWRHVSEAPRKLRPWPADREDDLEAVIEAALANKRRLREARDRRDFLTERIEGLSIFGDFALPPLGELRGERLWFYEVPVRERPALEAIDLPWAVVGRTSSRLHVAVVSREEPPADLLPVPRVRTGARRLSELRRELEDTEIEIERALAEQAELTRHRLALGLHLAQAADADDRRWAAALTLDAEPLFGLEGWAPEGARADLSTLAEERGLALLLARPGPDDAPPTLLENPGAFEGAGGLTGFYMTPAYRSWDPSLIVFFSFAIFFAMILADAGYAAVLAAGLALFGGALLGGERGRRLKPMLAVILGVAALYGVLAGSYFGFAPPEGSLPAAIAVIDPSDFDTMMAVSVVIGVFHVSLANLQVAWRNRGFGIRLAKGGWIAATIGGLLLWLAPGPIASALLVGGLIAVFAGSSLERPAGPGTPAWRRLADGLLGLTGITRMFGDVLSYMRLFALGLASGALAGTFNDIARQTVETVPGGGVALAGLVLLFGHGINLALGILSGVVHGLRLNFIEFFGWGLSEEGYPFRPFARRETAE